MDVGATATDGGATSAQRRPNHHTLKWGSWKAYKSRDKALQVRTSWHAIDAHTCQNEPSSRERSCPPPVLPTQAWGAAETGLSLTYVDGVIDSKSTTYPVLLTDEGAPLALIKDLLLWYSEQPMLPKEAVKTAQKYLMACMQMERGRRGLPLLPASETNKFMDVRVAVQQTQADYGAATITGCKLLNKRADHQMTFDHMATMMHLCLAGNAGIHPLPLAALQTAVEVRMTHMTGVRGELVRSAKFEHCWLRKNNKLAGGQGILSLVMCAPTRRYPRSPAPPPYSCLARVERARGPCPP